MRQRSLRELRGEAVALPDVQGQLQQEAAAQEQAGGEDDQGQSVIAAIRL